MKIECDSSHSVSDDHRPSSPVKSLAVIAALTAAMLGLVAVLGIGWFGSVGAFRAAASGRQLYIEQTELDVGKLHVDQVRMIDVTVTNLTGVPIPITGSRSSCGCTVVADLPMTLNAYSSSTIPIGIRGVTEGDLDVSVTLFTSRAEEQVHIRLTGTILARSVEEQLNSHQLEPIADPSFAGGSNIP